MKIYFPQWQGSGTGQVIENGAKAILEYLNDPEFQQIPLSKLPAGTSGEKKHNINNYDSITEQLTRLKEQINQTRPTTITTIGGDCGLEIVPVSYLNKKYPNLGVIWFDAHADINTPCDSPSCNFHGMPLRILLGEDAEPVSTLLFSTIEASQIHYIGLRDIDKAEQARIDKDHIYAPKKTDPNSLVQTLKAKNIDYLYLHFDFDCLEPQDYNKTYYQVPEGVKIVEAEEVIKSLKQNFTVVGSSVLESISKDPSELQPVKNIIHLLMK